MTLNDVLDRAPPSTMSICFQHHIPAIPQVITTTGRGSPSVRQMRGLSALGSLKLDESSAIWGWNLVRGERPRACRQNGRILLQLLMVVDESPWLVHRVIVHHPRICPEGSLMTQVSCATSFPMDHRAP